MAWGLKAALLALVLALTGAAPGFAQQAPAAPEIAPPATTSPTPEAATGQPRDLLAQPSLRLTGKSTWDDGFETLKKGMALLEAEAGRLALARIGAHLAHFVDSDDLGFSFELYAPLGQAAREGQTFSEGIAAAQTPAGHSIMFNYEGAYDEIDSAYEAITAWLDEKGLVATGRFLEEYVALPEKSDDEALKLNIYVFLR